MNGDPKDPDVMRMQEQITACRCASDIRADSIHTQLAAIRTEACRNYNATAELLAALRADFEALLQLLGEKGHA